MVMAVRMTLRFASVFPQSLHFILCEGTFGETWANFLAMRCQSTAARIRAALLTKPHCCVN